MAENNQLTTAWLAQLTNPHHDGTTQQIDDFVSAFVTDNARFVEKAQNVHQRRQREDDVWMKAQRDPAVKRLESADKQQDGYVSAARYINLGHAGLPDGEPTKQEAQAVEQVFKDYSFSTKDAYGAESDKIIQMQQNLQQHEPHLTAIGAWPFYLKAVEKAQLVRQILGERALTKGEFVKGEMKAARRATDVAIADLYKVITAMTELMPSAELTALVKQLKGIELYAKQYYISSASGASQTTPDANGGSTSDDSGSDGGSTGDNGGSSLPDDLGTDVPGGGSTGDNGNSGLPGDLGNG